MICTEAVTQSDTLFTICVQPFWGYYSVLDVSVEYYIFASLPKKEFAISQSVQNTFGHVTLNRIYINFDYWFIIYVLCHGNKTITQGIHV